MSSHGNDADVGVGAGAQYKLPSKEMVKQAGEVTIYDAAAKPILFKSLYSSNGWRKRVMVIFIRHFFCGVCQEYLKALAAGISPASLPDDVAVVVVGCGAPSLIPSYIENLGLGKTYPFPIYADQSKMLYGLFDMQSNLEIPSKPSEYFQTSMVAVIARSAVQMVKRTWHGDAASGGSFSQNGGEILFEVEGDVVRVPWFHRMMNTQDHAEIEEVKAVLKLDQKASPGA